MDSTKIKQIMTENVNKFKALPKKKQIIFGSAAGGGILLVLILLISLSCCGGKNNRGSVFSAEDPAIVSVKNAVLEYDESRTVETALKVRCSSLEWNHFTSDEGKNVVEVFGVWKDPQFTRVLNQNNPYLSKDFLKSTTILPGDVIHIQIIINATGSVNVAYGAICDSNRKIKCYPSHNLKMDTSASLKLNELLHLMYYGTFAD